jgi:hypothetical protein
MKTLGSMVAEMAERRTAAVKSPMGECFGSGWSKLDSKMEAVEIGHGVAPFYRPGNGEPRGRGREYGDGRWWVFNTAIGFKN